MIKSINHQNFLTTPLVAIKAWELFNVVNDGLLLTEGSPEFEIALDYIDYGGDSPLLNRECNIAFEQQDGNEVIYQEGITGSGVFDPDIEEQNSDGTYKRLVHAQTKQAFYNTYRNPTQLFGMDHVDFPLGKTDRQLSEFIRIFNLPSHYVGDRLVPNSIRMYDTLLDDNVEVRDDGYQNLLAGTNLFSKVQEIRWFGNIVIDGYVTNSCPVYDDTPITRSRSTSDTASVTVGFLYGSTEDRVESDTLSLMSMRFSSGLLFEPIVATYQSDSGSAFILMESGSIFDQIMYAYGNESSSVSVTMESGSIFNQVLTVSGSDSSSYSMRFYSGSITVQASVVPTKNTYQTMSVGFMNVTRSIVVGGTGYATSSAGTIVPE